MNTKNRISPSENEIIGTLLVIGNGFDLNCGLKSSFNDFFKTKISTIKSAADTYLNVVCDNIWYLLFYFAFYDETYYDSEFNQIVEKIPISNPRWMDIESFVKKIVTFNKKDDKWMNINLPINCSNYLDYLNS